MNTTKLQLDLIISTCNQQPQLSNTQIKQMLSILALSIPSSPTSSTSPSTSTSSPSPKTNQVKQQIDQLREIVSRKIGILDEKIEKIAKQNLEEIRIVRDKLGEIGGKDGMGNVGEDRSFMEVLKKKVEALQQSLRVKPDNPVGNLGQVQPYFQPQMMMPMYHPMPVWDNSVKPIQLVLKHKSFSDLSAALKRANSNVTHLTIESSTNPYNISRIIGRICRMQDFGDLQRNFLGDLAGEFGVLVGKFRCLHRFTYAFSHSLFDDSCWDNLVNGLNSIGTLAEVVVIVKGGYEIAELNWTQRIKTARVTIHRS